MNAVEISVVREFPRPRPSTSLCILGRSLCRRLSLLLLFFWAPRVACKLMQPTNKRGDRQKGGKSKKKKERKKRKEGMTERIEKKVDWRLIFGFEVLMGCWESRPVGPLVSWLLYQDAVDMLVCLCKLEIISMTSVSLHHRHPKADDKLSSYKVGERLCWNLTFWNSCPGVTAAMCVCSSVAVWRLSTT